MLYGVYMTIKTRVQKLRRWSMFFVQIFAVCTLSLVLARVLVEIFAVCIIKRVLARDVTHRWMVSSNSDVIAWLPESFKSLHFFLVFDKVYILYSVSKTDSFGCYHLHTSKRHCSQILFLLVIRIIRAIHFVPLSVRFFQHLCLLFLFLARLFYFPAFKWPLFEISKHKRLLLCVILTIGRLRLCCKRV